MRMKKVILAFLAAILMLSATACGVDLSSTAEESRTIMNIDGYDVPYEIYRYAALMHLRDRLAAEGAEGLDASGLSEDERVEIASEVEKNSLETIVNIYSIFTAAAEKGIDPFGEMINTLTEMEMEEIRATYENDKEYLETIKQFYMTDNVYSILTRYEIVFNQLYDEYVKNGDIDVSNEAVIEYMNGDNAVRVKQILISFERHTEEEAYNLASEIANTVKSYVSAEGIVDEAQFDDLTDKHGEDLFMFKNRDGYYICKGYSDKVFEEAAFALEIGHVSEPVRVSAGYSIMMRAEKDVAYIEENVDTLKEGCLGGIYRTMLDKFSANAKVEYNKDFEELDIYSMK